MWKLVKRALGPRGLGAVLLRFTCFVALAAMVPWSSACHDSSGSSPEAVPVLVLETSQHTGSITTTFDLTADVSTDVSIPADFTWDLGDGTTQTGSSISVQYKAPGTYSVRVEASPPGNPGVVIAEAYDLLVVIDPASPTGLFGEPVPPLPGDVDQDGILEIQDIQRIYQHLGGAVPLSTSPGAIDDIFTEVDLADVDLDGSITYLDAEIAAQTELLDEFPSLASPSHGLPGCLVTVFSPALTELEKAVTIQVGLSAPIDPVRVVPGQVTLVLPLDVLTPQTFTDVAGTTTIAILHDGVVVDSIPFDVEAFDPLPSDGIATIIESMDTAAAARMELGAALQALAAAPDLAALGLEAESIQATLAVLEEAELELRMHELELADLLEGALTSHQQEFVLRFCVANGLLDLAAALDSTNPFAAEAPLGSTAIAALCLVADAQEKLELASQVTSYSCTAVVALAVIIAVTPWFPDDIITVPALLAASASCAKFLAIQEVVGLFLAYIPSIGDELRLRPEGPTELPPGGSVTVVPEISISNLTSLCNLAGGKPVDEALEELLAEPITKKVLKKAPLGPIYAALKAVLPSVAEQFEEAVEDAVVLALGETVGQFFAGAIEKVCDALGGFVGPYFPVDPQLVSLDTTPTDPPLGITVGSESFTLTCPKSLTRETTYDVVGTIAVCDPVMGEISLHCADFVDVTITMGDNGSALDDIFQVAVDGDVVLTSSVPVTFAQTTLSLIVGDHDLKMTGLAAPDGIGTYYISVTGGQLTGGPPLSGSDLTAGTTFSWTLVVQGAP